MTTMTEANIRLGVLLAEAEKQQSALPVSNLEQAGLLPESLEAGMAAQAIATGAIGKGVSGWKVAINNTRPVAAPLLDLFEITSETDFIVPKPGVVAVEVEICFVLAEDIPKPEPTMPYVREDIVNRIASVHLGLELVSYRLVEENKAPFPLFLADRLGNHSFVLGPQIEAEWVDRLLSQGAELPPLEIEGDDGILFAAIPKHPQGDALAPLLAYANLPIDHLGGLKKGQVATTGSLCGIIRLEGQRYLRTRWGTIAELEIRFPDLTGGSSI
ncbi:2-keto-4-pentenoate hydratase [Agrobacterium larrymoorei]|uniref:2-keto-4-pentenoate hydratase n=1 Tax=Agrobacterium larrymoorei TaxID=160699 RepID=UPI001573DA47|nr:2-keto-4-pentenoate hydratase [Agrobacterium larrymoorei]NTJ41823.1 2-keto-4-pentenoate hydratase [Agrobacterium larrymoorei]